MYINGTKMWGRFGLGNAENRGQELYGNIVDPPRGLAARTSNHIVIHKIETLTWRLRRGPYSQAIRRGQGVVDIYIWFTSTSEQ